MTNGGDNIDLSGIPTYYVNHRILKDMGDGHVMAVAGMMMNGVFTPLYAAISPAETVLREGNRYVEIAQKAVCMIQAMVGLAH